MLAQAGNTLANKGLSPETRNLTPDTCNHGPAGTDPGRSWLNTLIQTHVADELRGRVMSVYGLIFYSAMPVGSLVIGHLAAAIGAPATVAVAGGFGVIFAVWLLVAYPALRQME